MEISRKYRVGHQKCADLLGFSSIEVKRGFDSLHPLQPHISPYSRVLQAFQLSQASLKNNKRITVAWVVKVVLVVQMVAEIDPA